MELNSFHRLYDWITWITSSISVGVGVMTWNEKLGMAGLVFWGGYLVGAHGYTAPAWKRLKKNATH